MEQESPGRAIGVYVGKDLDVVVTFCSVWEMMLMLADDLNSVVANSVLQRRGPPPRKLEEITQTARLIPHEQNLDSFCELIVDVPVLQMTEQLFGIHRAFLCQFFR